MPQPLHPGASAQIPLEKGTFLAQQEPEPGNREAKTAGDSTPCPSLVNPLRTHSLPEHFPLQGNPQPQIHRAQQIPATGWCEGRVVGAASRGWGGGIGRVAGERTSVSLGKVLWPGLPSALPPPFPSDTSSRALVLTGVVKLLPVRHTHHLGGKVRVCLAAVRGTMGCLEEQGTGQS